MNSRKHVFLDYEPSPDVTPYHPATYREIRAWVLQEYGKGSLIIQKRDSQTDEVLPGAEFRITTAAGCEVGLDGVSGAFSSDTT